MTKILIDEAVVRQALKYLQDNQHLIADNERHAYVMLYNAFIERFEQTIAEAKQPAPAQPWVGLTKQEAYDLYHSDYVVFYKNIEAKLKEKNTKGGAA